MYAVSFAPLAALVAACQLLTFHDAAAADQALIGAAKKEGAVTWYTTLIANQMARPAVDAFQKKYGIKVTYIRADTNVSMLRIQNEAQAGKTQADVVDTTSGTPALKRMGLLEKWLPDSARDAAQGLYRSARLLDCRIPLHPDAWLQYRLGS